jgi:autophagy-related protein 11
VYRGEVHGLLPFDTKGMDEPVPAIDFSPVGSSELPYSLQRADIDGNVLSSHAVSDDLTRGK